jgi:hypothetical protein
MRNVYEIPCQRFDLQLVISSLHRSPVKMQDEDEWLDHQTKGLPEMSDD